MAWESLGKAASRIIDKLCKPCAARRRIAASTAATPAEKKPEAPHFPGHPKLRVVEGNANFLLNSGDRDETPHPRDK